MSQDSQPPSNIINDINSWLIMEDFDLHKDVNSAVILARQLMAAAAQSGLTAVQPIAIDFLSRFYDSEDEELLIAKSCFSKMPKSDFTYHQSELIINDVVIMDVFGRSSKILELLFLNNSVDIEFAARALSIGGISCSAEDSSNPLDAEYSNLRKILRLNTEKYTSDLNIKNLFLSICSWINMDDVYIKNMNFQNSISAPLETLDYPVKTASISKKM